MSAARHVLPRAKQDSLEKRRREMQALNAAIAAGKGDVPRKPIAAAAEAKPPRADPLDYTDRLQYQVALEESKRMAPIEGAREAQLIREAEHAAELRYLTRQAQLMERIAELEAKKSE